MLSQSKQLMIDVVHVVKVFTSKQSQVACNVKQYSCVIGHTGLAWVCILTRVGSAYSFTLLVDR